MGKVEGLGGRIKARREALGLSQTGLGKLIGAHGQEISEIERGLRNPSGARTRDLADHLDCSADWLLGRTGAKPPAKPRRKPA